MAADRVECSRCGETFEDQDQLVYHSIDVHAGTTTSVSGTTDPSVDDHDDIDEETVERLLAALEERGAARPSVRVRYGQRFLLTAAVGILTIVLVLSYLQLQGAIQTTVYLFSVGMLFGIALTYLQALVQSARQ